MTADPAPEPQARVLDLLLAPFRTAAVYAAVQLGITDLLAGGPATPAEVAEHVRTDPGATARLLRMLHALDLLTVDGGRYTLSAAGEVLAAGHPDSVRDLVPFYSDLMHPPLRHVTHSITTGEAAFPLAHGADTFTHLSGDPAAGRLFDAAMVSGGAPVFRALPHARDWSADRHVVDVAGGDGTLLTGLLTAHPHLRGTLAEMPRLLAAATERVAAAGLAERCTVVEGDLFGALPGGGDVYLLCRILHDFADDDAAAILRSVRAAAPEGATLLVLERLLPADGTHAIAVDFDLHMLVNAGGRERTRDAYAALLTAAGFRPGPVTTLPMGFRLLAATAQAPHLR